MVRADGWAPEAQRLRLSTDGSRNQIVVTLRREGVVRGRVVDANGNAVPGAIIRSFYVRDVAEQSILNGFAGGRPTTDENGRFEIRGLVPGLPITLRATLGSLSTETNTITVSADGMGTDVVVNLR